MFAKIKALYQRLPLTLRQEMGHVLVAFAAAFIAVAAPLAPGLLHSPDLHTAKALLVALLAGGIAAGLRSCKPLLSRAVAAWIGSALRHKFTAPPVIGPAPVVPSLLLPLTPSASMPVASVVDLTHKELTMPVQIRGEDGRIVADNLSETDGQTLAVNVHANTGELVTVVPLVHDGETYVPDESAARTVGAAPVAAVEDEEPSAETLEVTEELADAGVSDEGIPEQPTDEVPPDESPAA